MPKKHSKIAFSSIELNELALAWMLVSLAFAIVLAGNISFFAILVSFVLSGATVGFGFIFHELSHKLVAQHFGCFAEFRANRNMLLLALLTSFLGFVYAAPGAVIIQGQVSKKERGLISLAGPAANIVIALLFFMLRLFVPIALLRIAFNYGLYINSFLALFNLIPFGNLDGAKVFQWNKLVYFAILTTAGSIMVLSSF